MNVGFISLGCSKNLVDTEMVIGLFKHHDYKIVNDTQMMLTKNIAPVPQGEINGKLLNFSEANIWVNQQEG